MNDAEVALATALTNMVLPVPVVISYGPRWLRLLVAHQGDRTEARREVDRYRSFYTSPSIHQLSEPVQSGDG
jgi:hypothetical protein